MITQIIRKQLFSGKLIPRQLMRVSGVFQKVPYERAELHKIIRARNPCVTDVLCNWETNSQTIIICVCKIILGLIVYTAGAELSKKGSTSQHWRCI